MARFDVENDPGFISIAGQLQRWVRQLSEPSGKLPILNPQKLEVVREHFYAYIHIYIFSST